MNCLRAARLALAAGLLLAARAQAQQPAGNDGFRRRNGQMEVIRNGQPYAMTRDAHLPTGATVTKDGFVVSATGQRTELREGQGCDLRGRPVPVLAGPTGALALARPGAAAGPARAVPANTLLEQVFGRDDDGNGFFKFKKAKKHHGKGKGHGRWKDD
ncbi:hypothetical protein MON38_06955 [Hymenobacter sp. DH14]|uniref:DUF6799 domain-containing protein n=1 Tax=Hymenobacter cyanobacteriorum TaxID=2926463 RepID=A0A9X1VDI6_9BACT|nr:DUF6799 domain-containing protein [Hymenobacter cyanobacteriorum]MCI1187154.1 hypothetical protein [Hymenobacter cyanobacteriorum]